MRIRYRAQALRDVAEIFRYIEERSPTGAHNVLQSIRDGIMLVAEQPDAGIRTDDPTVRVKFVRRYRYKIFYSNCDSETIEILHVRHTSRESWSG
jgi:toxin ParE1/3/4